MKKNKLDFIDYITLCYYTFIKNFYHVFNHKLNLSYGKKIKKLISKRDKLDNKIFNKYQQAKTKYDKYIAYLQYKELHK